MTEPTLQKICTLLRLMPGQPVWSEDVAFFYALGLDGYPEEEAVKLLNTIPKQFKFRPMPAELWELLQAPTCTPQAIAAEVRQVALDYGADGGRRLSDEARAVVNEAYGSFYGYCRDEGDAQYRQRELLRAAKRLKDDIQTLGRPERLMLPQFTNGEDE